MSELGSTKQTNSVITAPSRRGFVATLAAALGVSLDLIGADPPNCAKPGDPFTPVPELISKNKKLAATMTVKSAEKSVATIAGQGYQCRAMKLRYYEGQEAGNAATKFPEI